MSIKYQIANGKSRFSDSGYLKTCLVLTFFDFYAKNNNLEP